MQGAICSRVVVKTPRHLQNEIRLLPFSHHDLPLLESEARGSPDAKQTCFKAIKQTEICRLELSHYKYHIVYWTT